MCNTVLMGCAGRQQATIAQSSGRTGWTAQRAANATRRGVECSLWTSLNALRFESDRRRIEVCDIPPFNAAPGRTPQLPRHQGPVLPRHQGPVLLCMYTCRGRLLCLPVGLATEAMASYMDARSNRWPPVHQGTGQKGSMGRRVFNQHK